MTRRGRPPVEIKVTIIGRPCESGLEAVAQRLLKMMQDRPALELVKQEKDLQSAEVSL